MDFSVLKEWIAGNTAGMIALENLLTSHPALAPESGGEGELKKVLALETWLKEQGITQLERFDAPDSRVESGIRPNLVATITGADDADSSAPRIWIMAHTDVVPVGEISLWNTDPWQVVE